MKPYTYFLLHRPTGLKYYGAKYSKNADPTKLWVNYFSSSKKVKKLIQEYGKDSFDFEIRKTFKTKEETLLWEQSVLKRLKVDERKDWLNVHIYGGRWFVNIRTAEHKKHKQHPPISEETKKKISESRMGIQFSEEHKKNLSLGQTGKKKRQFKKRIRPLHSLETKNKIKLSWIERRKKFGPSGRIE